MDGMTILLLSVPAFAAAVALLIFAGVPLQSKSAGVDRRMIVVGRVAAVLLAVGAALVLWWSGLGPWTPLIVGGVSVALYLVFVLAEGWSHRGKVLVLVTSVSAMLLSSGLKTYQQDGWNGLAGDVGFLAIGPGVGAVILIAACVFRARRASRSASHSSGDTTP